VAVTTAEFLAMTAQPYSQARSQLQTGDLLLFSSKGGFSAIIEHFTNSLWSHAGLVWRVGDADFDRVLILESIDTLGIRAVSASNRLNGTAAAPAPYGGAVLVARHRRLPQPLSAARVLEMTRYGVDHLGFPYNPEELAKIAVRIAAGLANITLPGHLEPTNSFICSEFVAKCYAAVGVDLAPDKEGYMAPADIAADPDVFAVARLCPDPPQRTAAA
jgi:cell wall-associated NlpC family hydrolase